MSGSGRFNGWKNAFGWPVASIVLVAIGTMGFAACRTGDPPHSVEVDEQTYQRVEDALGNGQFDTVESLLAAADMDTTSAMFAYLRGRLDEQLGFDARAARRYTQAIRRDPRLARGWYQLALTDVRRRNYRAAAEHFGRSLELHETAEAWHGLGQSYFELGKPDSARYGLEHALELAPNYASARLAYATLLQAQGADSTAEEQLRRVLSVRDDATARRMLGNLLVNRDPPGRDAASEAVDLLEASRRQKPWDAQVHYDLARAYRLLDRTAEADSSLAAFEYYTDIDAAIFRLQERIRLSPTAIRDRLELADLFRTAGRYDDALATLYRVMYLIPDNLHILNNAAILHMAKGQSQAARVLYETAVVQDSAFVPALLGLARLEMQSGNVAGASAWLTRVEAVDPGNAEAARLRSESN